MIDFQLDTASAALSKAEEIGGTIRVINRPKIPSRRNHLKQKKGVQFDDDDDTEVHPGELAMSYRLEISGKYV